MGLHVPQPCFHMFEEHARNQTLGQRRSVTKNTTPAIACNEDLKHGLVPPEETPLGHYHSGRRPRGMASRDEVIEAHSPPFLRRAVIQALGTFTL